MPSYNNKDFKESNINYLNKEFGEIKQSLISYAKSYFPNTYKDFNETSPGMMLLEMNAYVGDVLSFYIDQQYREMLLPLAEERRSVINMAKMFGYKVKPIIPAVVNITFTQAADASIDNPSKIDYTSTGVFPSGIQVASNTNTSLIFETLDVVDFTISQSNDNSVDNIKSVDDTTGLASIYTVSRNVKAVSGQTKTKTFNIGEPTKFLKLTLPDKDVIDIISCIDSNGNDWYEVDFLAQDKVSIPNHYTNTGDGTSERESAYYDLDGNQVITDVPVPYSLTYIQTNKRFTRETNSDNTTSLVFGNGILKTGTTLNSNFLDLEQAGITVPGQADDLDGSIDTLLGDEYSTLGETPIQTSLVITYRVGGGINSNVPTGDLTTFTSPSAVGGTGTIDSATNNLPAMGGKDEETTDEIREKAKAFFATQNRCVTKEDYEARVLNIPPKFGSIAKAYVARANVTSIQANSTADAVDGITTATTGIQTELGKIISHEPGTDFTSTYQEAACTGLNEPAGCPDWYACINTEGTMVGNYGDDTCAESCADDYNCLGAWTGVSITTDIVDYYTISSEQATEIENNRLAMEQISSEDYISDITTALNGLPDIPVDFEIGTITIYVLAYNQNKNLVGNPIAGKAGYESLTDGIPQALEQNIKAYMNNFKILTDSITIDDGFIINFGAFFDVVAHKFADKNTVKLQCMQKIKDYFKVEKMQFSQPIYISQLEYELMDIDGVRAVNYVTITQQHDYNAASNGQDLPSPTYTYEYDSETSEIKHPGSDGTGVEGYGYMYNFESATKDGVILPPSPANPGVFELKNPNQNIMGVVR